MKFATKLSLLFSGIFLILSFFITEMVVSSSRETLERIIQTQMERRTAEKMDRIDKFFFERDLDTKMMATDSVLRSKKISPDLISARLKELSKNSGSYISLSFFDMSRKRIVDTLGQDAGRVHSLSEYWPEIESGKESAFDMYYSESLRIPVFHFAKVVKNDAGAPLGVLVARVSTGWLDEIAKQTAMPEIKVEIVNRDGLVIYSSYNPGGVLKEHSIYWENIKAEIGRGKVEKSYRLKSPGKEEEIVVYGTGQGYKDFTGNGWTLIAHMPGKAVFAPAIELRNRLLIIMAAGGGFSLLAIVLFARTVSRPLSRLSAAAGKIGRGDLDVRVAVDSNDEVGGLAARINEMAANISTSHKAMEKAKKEAEEATKLKDKFIMLLSHDLKTPLVGMQGMMQLVQDQPDIRPENRRMVELAIQGSKRMLDMIDKLLDVGRIQSGKLHLKSRYCDGAEIIREAVETVGTMASQKGITIRNTVPDKIMVLADPVFLKEVFGNLLSNAIKFSEQGKAVTVKYLPGENMVFAVEDSGVGIRPGDLKKIFSFHEKTTTNGTMGETGTGFGLPLSADIVGALNGKLEARSSPEGGASLLVTLPKPAPKLLIMENHPGSCNELKISLEERGFKVRMTAHALKILESLKEERFDLLVVELSTAKDTGAELLRLVSYDMALEGMPVLEIGEDTRGHATDHANRENMPISSADIAMIVERIYSLLMADNSPQKE